MACSCCKEIATMAVTEETGNNSSIATDSFLQLPVRLNFQKSHRPPCFGVGRPHNVLRGNDSE